MTERLTRQQLGTIYVLLVQRHYPRPSIAPLVAYCRPDPAHQRAAELLNTERRRLRLPEDATPDNWSMLLDEMRKQHEVWIDISVTPTKLAPRHPPA